MALHRRGEELRADCNTSAVLWNHRQRRRESLQHDDRALGFTARPTWKSPDAENVDLHPNMQLSVA